LVDERIGVVNVGVVGISQGRQCDSVDARYELLRILGVEELCEKCVKLLAWRPIERRGRTSHLGDATSQPVGVLGAIPLMEGKRAFRFPDRYRRKVGEHGVHQPSLRPVQTQQSLDVLFDRVADAGSLLVGRDAGQLRYGFFGSSHG